MSAPATLSLSLEADPPRFRAGAPIRGVVTVSAPAGASCEVDLGFIQRTRTKRFEGDLVHRLAGPVVRRGRVPESGVERCAFEVPAPAGPATYHGLGLDLECELSARATLGGSVVEESIPIELRPAVAEAVRITVSDAGGAEDVSDLRPGKLIVRSAGLALCLLGLVWAIPDRGIAIPFIGFATLLALILVWKSARRVLTDLRFGRAALRMEPAGDDDPAYRATVWLRPGAPVERLTVTLVVVENTQRRSDRDGVNVPESTEIAWGEEAALEPVERGEFAGRVPLPEFDGDPIYSHGSGWIGLRWRAQIRAHLRGGGVASYDRDLWAEPDAPPRPIPGSALA
ncbi:MAG TPA: hypothetical protein RMH99_20705 [Sandaracinaceae bacterium LLY-WYZ-13_1]|nr:hypothetical protein [Sandaracinaceae bacterium LLY-WYZ-13_1]